MNIQISEQAYQKIQQAAQSRGTTPEALIESMADQLPIGFAQNEDEFYKSLGMDEQEIEQIKEQAKQLPDEPNW